VQEIEEGDQFDRRSCIRSRAILCPGGFILGALTTFAVMAYIIGGFQPSSPSKRRDGTNHSTDFGCTVETDVKILLKDSDSFLKDQTKCGHDNLGIAKNVARCLEKATGISSPCAKCYGEMTECGKHECLTHCMFGPSPSCSSCVCKVCTPTFRKCGKLPCTLYPSPGNKDVCGNCPGKRVAEEQRLL